MSNSYRTASAGISGDRDRTRGVAGELAKRLWDRFRDTLRQIGSRISFWTVIAAAVCLSTIYYFAFAESMYDSQSIVTVQNKSSVSTGAGSVLGSVLGTSAAGTQVEQIYDYINSPDMLKILDQKFHLRKIYSSDERNPFWRLWWPSSDDSFLSFYQNMIEILPDTTNGMVTIDALGYSAKRAHAIASEIVAQSQKYMNHQAGIMQTQTMKFSQDELAKAVKAVQAAKIPYEQSIAELRLSAAQQALATATGLANQQQTFLIPVAVPSYPTNATRPERLLDIAAITLIAALGYAVGFLMWANVRDHRKT